MPKWNRKIRNILGTAGNFLSSFITAVVAMVALLFVVIKLLGWNMFSVDSPSMSPQYPVDTLVIVQNVEPEDIQVGDVITYVLNRDGVLVTHRVVGISKVNETFTTKGDANNSADASPVIWNNVVGKVLLGIPGLGKPIRFLTASENRPLVIAAIAALFVFSLVWDIIAKKNQKKRETAALPECEDGAAGPPTDSLREE